MGNWDAEKLSDVLKIIPDVCFLCISQDWQCLGPDHWSSFLWDKTSSSRKIGFCTPHASKLLHPTAWFLGFLGRLLLEEAKAVLESRNPFARKCCGSKCNWCWRDLLLLDVESSWVHRILLSHPCLRTVCSARSVLALGSNGSPTLYSL